MYSRPSHVRATIVAALFAIALPATARGESIRFGGVLTGERVVPPANTEARGAVILTVDSETMVLDILVLAVGVPRDAITGISLHQGAAGANGPSFFDLPVDNGAVIQIGSVTVVRDDGRVLSLGEIEIILADEAYLLVRTVDFPDGELRAQFSNRPNPDDDTGTGGGGGAATDDGTLQADAGNDQTIIDADDSGDELVSLDGSLSLDLDSEIVRYEWFENGGIVATGPTPMVLLTVGLHELTLTVTSADGGVASDTVVVAIEARGNTGPTAVAVATPPATTEGSEVTLDASASTDPDGDPLRFRWRSLSLPSLVIENDDAAIATFIAPSVGPDGTTLLFEVTVDDTRGGVAESVVSVPVADVPAPAPTRDIVSMSDDDMVPTCGVCGPIGFVGFSGMLCGWLALNLFTPSRNRRRRR